MTAPSSRSGHRTAPVVIPPAGLEGTLEVPRHAGAVVVFAHYNGNGNGRGRRRPRDRRAAAAPRRAGLATLLAYRPTGEEGACRRQVLFGTGLLARRLEAAAHLAIGRTATEGLAAGRFGASAPAAVVLITVAKPRGTAAPLVRAPWGALRAGRRSGRLPNPERPL